MKKVLCMAIVLIFAIYSLTICAFADDGTIQCSYCQESIPDYSNYCLYCGKKVLSATSDLSFTVTGTEDTGDKTIEFPDGVILAENEYVTVYLTSFFEKEVNWVGKGKAIEKNIVIKAHNNSDVEYIFNLNDTYIGEDGVKIISSSGNSGPAAGKSKSYQYNIQKDIAPDGVALDNLDQLFDLEGTFQLHVYNSDRSKIVSTSVLKFKIADVLSGAMQESENNNSNGPTSEMIEAALLGKWAYDNNTLTFDNGDLTIFFADGSILNGTYAVNMDTSTIDARLNANDGTVKLSLPFSYNNDVLILMNNKNEELVKQ